MKKRNRVLPVIVVSQFCGTSLWFAGNGIMTELIDSFQLHPSALGHLTSAVQLGFITGTLIFALLTVADRFSPSRVFLLSAAAGALFNLGLVFRNNDLISLLFFRYLTGFFLAGIYPVGMKLAADHFKEGLGKSLGFLVGALVVGTAFPHLLSSFPVDLPWQRILLIISLVALAGGIMVYLLVPDGPYRKPAMKLEWSAIFRVFGKPQFRTAAFGYFGHMWELYAFWAFVPVMLMEYKARHPENGFNVPLMSFMIIGLGGLACVAGGYISMKVGTRKTASAALFLSGLCCLVSPFFLTTGSSWLFLAFLVFWGLVVIADSPLFSTLVANHAMAEYKGTALTIVNSIGFAVTIVSIQLLNYASQQFAYSFLFVILGAGPVFGLVFLLRSKR